MQPEFQPMQITLSASTDTDGKETRGTTAPSQPVAFSLFNPPLDKLAEMGEEDFRRIFAHSPIRRTKYRGWLRNLCVVMGNSGDRRFIPRLEELSRLDDPIVREHAAWALQCLKRAPKSLLRPPIRWV